MKTTFYFFMFLLSLLCATWSLFTIGNYTFPEEYSFIGMFILTFLSLAGSILFGYAFSYHIKN